MNVLQTTLGASLKHTAQLFALQPAIFREDATVSMTWASLDQASDSFAKGLLQMGLSRGDRLALWMTNREAWVVAYFAAVKVGIIPVPISTGLKAEELRVILREVEATALLFTDGYRSESHSALIRESFLGPRSGIPSLRIFIHSGEEAFPEATSFEAVFQRGQGYPEPLFSAACAEVAPDDIGVILFTSGTTSTPKGVMLSHKSLVTNAYYSGLRMRMSEKDRLCLPVPFFHCFGLSAGILLCMTHGCAMVPVETYRPLDVMRVVERCHCTALHGVPTMFLRILDHPDFLSFDFSSLRTGIIAGSPVTKRVLLGIVERMHMTEICVSYGQTETSPCCTQTFAEDTIETKMKTIGVPLPFVEVCIRNHKTGSMCSHGEIGEILTRGYHVMNGYWNKPELTRMAIDKDKWFHTGDLGMSHEDGSFSFCSRLKDIIIRGGENISPREISSAILEHGSVEDVCVFGIPDEIYGEEIAVSVCLKVGERLDELSLRQFLTGRLARYKIPKYIEFCSVYPVLPNGKIQISAVRDRMKKRVEALKSGNLHSMNRVGYSTYQ